MSLTQTSASSLGARPDFIAQSEQLNLNDAAHQNLQSGFAVVSYKGKNWAIRYRGDIERMMLPASIDAQGRTSPPAPAAYFDVIVVGVAGAISKSFYEKRFNEGDDQAPDCFSVNGVSPDPASPKPQHTHCAVCPQNRFGSRITEVGKKAKACQDYRRLAVVPVDDVANEDFGGPMMLRIPPMSLLNLDRYCTDLARMGADISQVQTMLGFNNDVAYPEITFVARGWLTSRDDVAQAVEHAKGELVHRMLNTEVVEATHDSNATQAALAGGPPAHLQQPAQPEAPPPPPPAPPAPTPPLDPAPTPTVPAAQALSPFAAAKAARAARAGSGAHPQPLVVPLARPQPLPTSTTVVSQPAPAPQAAPQVIQGAPASMEQAIDQLLQQ